MSLLGSRDTQSPDLWVGAFSYHGFLYTPKKRLFGFGWNSNYQLGLGVGDSSNHLKPVAHPFFNKKSNIFKVACGHIHTVILTCENRVFYCGAYQNLSEASNCFYFLGGNEETPKLPPSRIIFGGYGISHWDASPVPVEGFPTGAKILDIEAGESSSFFTTVAHGVWSFGVNDRGQLGVGSKVDSDVPQRVQFADSEAGKIISGVAAGSTHALFVATDGTVYQTGVLQTSANATATSSETTTLVPTVIASFCSVRAVKCGRFYSLFHTDDHRVFLRGELGACKCDEFTIIAEHVSRMECGAAHAILEKRNDGGVFCAGRQKDPNQCSTNMNVDVAGAAAASLLLMSLPRFSKKRILGIAASSRNQFYITSDFQIWAAGKKSQLWGPLGLYEEEEEEEEQVKGDVLEPRKILEDSFVSEIAREWNWVHGKKRRLDFIAKHNSGIYSQIVAEIKK